MARARSVSRTMERVIATLATTDPLPLTPENLDAVRDVVMRLWRERAAERLLPDPLDLSGSCKFSSMLVSALFGLEMRGNEDHQFCVTADGEIIDLNAGAEDVRIIHLPHRHDPAFWGCGHHAQSLATCLPRVLRWAETARREIAENASSPSNSCC